MNTLNGKSNSSKQIDSLQKLIDGINKRLSKVPSLTLADQSMTPAQLVTLLQGRIDALRLVQAKAGEWHAAVQQLNAGRAATKVVVTGFDGMLRAMFQDASVLADFGIVARKRRAPTANTKAQAVVKSKVTRKARGTAGSRQKAKVHGTVDVSQTASTKTAPIT